MSYLLKGYNECVLCMSPSIRAVGVCQSIKGWDPLQKSTSSRSERVSDTIDSVGKNYFADKDLTYKTYDQLIKI